jgi:hypothetical protein
MKSLFIHLVITALAVGLAIGAFKQEMPPIVTYPLLMVAMAFGLALVVRLFLED